MTVDFLDKTADNRMSALMQDVCTINRMFSKALKCDRDEETHISQGFAAWNRIQMTLPTDASIRDRAERLRAELDYIIEELAKREMF